MRDSYYGLVLWKMADYYNIDLAIVMRQTLSCTHRGVSLEAESSTTRVRARYSR